MTELQFAQIDAFASAPFTGNPAGVMPLDAWLPDDVLQAIAEENNLSETAFIIPDASGDSDYELRWHTPAAEVALCGHATLAAGHFVLRANPDMHRVAFRTRQAGILTVTRVGDGYALALPAWTPTPAPLDAIVAALGVEATATLWHDKGYALVVVADAAAVENCAPDLHALKACGKVVAIVTARGRDSDIVSRVFTPFFAIDEDPVTGSAHAVAVPYWAQVLGKAGMTAVQASARGGRLGCRLDGDRVILTGTCVTVIEGVFRL